MTRKIILSVSLSLISRRLWGRLKSASFPLELGFIVSSICNMRMMRESTEELLGGCIHDHFSLHTLVFRVIGVIAVRIWFQWGCSYHIFTFTCQVYTSWLVYMCVLILVRWTWGSSVSSSIASAAQHHPTSNFARPEGRAWVKMPYHYTISSGR